jgi:MoaA/NifB/PqqE/SkfB family radical SAM enzyme
MANSHKTMLKQGELTGNKYDFEPGLSDAEIMKRAEAIRDGKDITNTQVGYEGKDADARQNWLQTHKPRVHEKMMQFPEKLAMGEGIPIIQFQYDYLCNMDCEHCCIDKFYVPKNWEKESGRRKFEMEDVRRLSKEADEMGLANFVITGGEPLIIPEFEQLIEAIDPSKFWIACDSNGWNLDLKKAKWLKSIGVDKMQLSLDGVDAESHDTFRRAPGSWERVIRAIDACKEAGLHAILSTVVWKDRVYEQEWRDFLEFAKEKEIASYVVYAKPVGAYEGNTTGMLTEKEEKIIMDFEKEYDIFTHMSPSYGRDIGCIAVKRMISLSRYGDFMPCPYQHVALGNFFEESLKDILDRSLNIKWFDPAKNMPCICGVDKGFIENVISHTYGDSEVPVPYNQVFTDDDFVNLDGPMGKVKHGSGCGTEVRTWKEAPLITLKGKQKKATNVEDMVGNIYS